MWNKTEIKHCRRCSRKISVILFQFNSSFILCCASRLSKSNFKDHYGEAVKEHYLSMIAEIEVFSVSDKMLLFQSRGRGRDKLGLSAY